MLLRTLVPTVGVALACAVPAQAAPTWLDPEAPFGDVPALDRDAGAAMAPDGTIVVARFAPSGELEVRERPPGGPFGATVTIPPVGLVPRPLPNLEVLTGADGTAAVLFDAGNVRYAALRSPGGSWRAPAELALAPTGPGAAAIAPKGVLWTVSRNPGEPGRLFVHRLAPSGTVRSTPLPAPPAGSEDLTGVIAAPQAGRVRVAYLQRRTTAVGQRCTETVSILSVEVGAEPPALLDSHEATGTFQQGVCDRTAGTIVGPMLLTATGSDGSDTVTYAVLRLADFNISTLARHRSAGGMWPDPRTPAEVVSAADHVPEKLLAGAVIVVRGGADKHVNRRTAYGHWTAPVELTGLFGAHTFEAARTGAGTSVFAWVDAGSRNVVTRVMGADGSLGAPVTVRRTGTALLAAGGDAEGNAAILYTEPFGYAARLLLSRYDGAGPRPAMPRPVRDVPMMPRLPAIPPPPQGDRANPAGNVSIARQLRVRVVRATMR